MHMSIEVVFVQPCREKHIFPAIPRRASLHDSDELGAG
jgi:hypothetical protein